MVLQHGIGHRLGVDLGALHHQHGGDGMRGQLPVLLRCQLVPGIQPVGRHIEHAHVVQQSRRRQIRALLGRHPLLHAQKDRHHHHQHAVLEQFRHLVAHHRHLEAGRLGPLQIAQRFQQQVVALAHVLRQQLAQRRRAGQQQHLGFQAGAVYRIAGTQLLIDRCRQAVLDQLLVQAAVDAPALVQQLDAAFGVDRAVGHHLLAVCHVGDGTQEVCVVVQRRRIQKQGGSIRCGRIHP